MSRLDPAVVQARCAEIAEALDLLAIPARMEAGEFVQDRDARDLASDRLLVAVEAALALCAHACARLLRVAPDEYAACFGLLADRGLLEPQLADRLKRMARFRNLLVHMYWKVDHRRVHELLRHDLDDPACVRHGRERPAPHSRPLSDGRRPATPFPRRSPRRLRVPHRRGPARARRRPARDAHRPARARVDALPARHARAQGDPGHRARPPRRWRHRGGRSGRGPGGGGRRRREDVAVSLVHGDDLRRARGRLPADGGGDVGPVRAREAGGRGPGGLAALPDGRRGDAGPAGRAAGRRPGQRGRDPGRNRPWPLHEARGRVAGQPVPRQRAAGARAEQGRGVAVPAGARGVGAR